MKAMELSGDWGVKNLKQIDRPEPTAGPGEIVIKVDAISINPRDAIAVAGGYGRLGRLPIIPLCDGAGTVVETGPGVTEFSVGDLVCPMYSRTWLHGLISDDAHKGALGMAVDGMAQEYFLTPAEAVVRAPQHLNAREAATLPCAAVTAWNAVVEQGNIRAGQRVVIQGTGGVALFALQFAKMHGAEVILTSSSDEKLEHASHLGADHTINYRSTLDWHKKVREITNNEGVDNIIEVGGAGTLVKSISCVATSGAISLIGVLDGIAGEINLGPVVTRNIRLQGITVGSGDIFKNMVKAMELHKTHPTLNDEGFALEELGVALGSLSKGQHFGKIVCEM